VYGQTFISHKRAREKDAAVPVNPYGGSKRLMELAALNFVKAHGLDIMIVRAFNFIGTGQNPSYAFADFCRQVTLMERKRQPPVLHVGDIRVIRDFLHVSDGVRGYEILAQKGKTGGIYNLGSGKGLRLSEAVHLLKKISPIDFKVESMDARFRKSDLPWIVSNPAKLQALGWRPRKSVLQGLHEILNEWREKLPKGSKK
jgi:GDP-4-dehydro-6-deoxy-D-mannose reductase